MHLNPTSRYPPTDDYQQGMLSRLEETVNSLKALLTEAEQARDATEAECREVCPILLIVIIICQSAEIPLLHTLHAAPANFLDNGARI